jgi:hypothetical protein
MKRNQYGSSRTSSSDIFKSKTRNLAEPGFSNRSQLTSMKKSIKPIISKGVIPFKIVSRNVSIGNYIAGHTTNNITVNINHPVIECKSERTRSNNISIFTDPFKVKSKYIKSNRNTMTNSLTFESTRNGFNTIDSRKKYVTLTSNTDKEDSIKNNFLNKMTKKPKGVIKQVTRPVTEYLNTNNEDDFNLENMIQMYTMDRFKNMRRDAERSQYDLSEYYVNDENKDLKDTMTSKDYGFINKIKNEIKFKLFDTRAFLELRDDPMFNILSFCYPFYDKMIQINKVIKKKIHITLNNKFNHTIQLFRNLYSDYLDLQEYLFQPKYIIKNRTKCNINLFRPST